jgi:hypothetical protein
MWETASPGAWYGFWHRHVAVLLHVARPDLDADYLAHALLAADTHAALRERTDVHRVSSGIQALAALMLQEPPCAVRASCSVNIIRELRRSGLRRVTITMKKLVNDPADVVSEALRGMAAATPSCGSTIEQDYLSGWRSDVGEGRADLRGWLW